MFNKIYFLLFISFNYFINTLQAKYSNQNYSINLIWINQNLDYKQTSLLTQNQFETLADWSKKNPLAQINLWLDAKLTGKTALKNLFITVEQINLKLKNFKIKLCNIRKLKKVIKHPEAFDSQIPIYFRIDLIKILIAKESLSRNQKSYFICTDFDIKPITRKKLFDRKTYKALQKNYFILARSNNKFGFENGFQIFKYHKDLMHALDFKIIQPAIQQAQNFIATMPQQIDLINQDQWHAQRANFQETIFRAYPDMITYFYKLSNQDCPKTACYTKKISMPASKSQNFELKNC